ncbi:AMP-binding protein [Fodinicola feengrottensis]|uniref:AMP-binding protein n=1 Tax=Fodinicola feengrottensis TaxID=435914 RepID=UPI0024433BF8|nr:AMP-binding protein [Fodinicola feengrottensis]
MAIYAGAEQVTYAELFARICAMGTALTTLGVRREQRVLLILDDSPDFPTVFLGAARIGAVPVPVNPALNIDDYRFFPCRQLCRRRGCRIGSLPAHPSSAGRSGRTSDCRR